VELTNEELWNRLREGSISAIEDLYRLNYQVLYSYAFKICGEKEMSKDCVQELFVTLWEKRSQLKEVSKVRSYLLQSIWHSLIKIMKRRNKSLGFDENNHYDIELVFSTENVLIQNQTAKENKAKLHNALSSLSSRQKQIIFMQYYEGLSIEEIQKITELKYQSIKNLTHRAMLSLRDFMKK
jgi:RNA polymerase sigma factor (sigma-70 family)